MAIFEPDAWAWNVKSGARSAPPENFKPKKFPETQAPPYVSKTPAKVAARRLALPRLRSVPQITNLVGRWAPVVCRGSCGHTRGPSHAAGHVHGSARAVQHAPTPRPLSSSLCLSLSSRALA